MANPVVIDRLKESIRKSILNQEYVSPKNRRIKK
jgi:hypothetical protein